MQMRKNQQVAFAALASLFTFTSSSPPHPLSPRGAAALSNDHALSLLARGIPVVESKVPLKLHSNYVAGTQLAKRQGGAPFRTIAAGASYAIDVTIGTETLQLLFDTGSSSFWVPEADFVCVDNVGKQQ
jgi:hypothetical protein